MGERKLTMSDKELADKIVALGVGDVSPTFPRSPMYRVPGALGEAWLSADEFVRDWRVFGALWEKLYARGESDDCRKMIEDLVEALS